MEEYTTIDGINYRGDGFAFCDRCGSVPIVNNKCLKCDVTPTEADVELAKKIERLCFSKSTVAIPGCYGGRHESFNTERAAQIIAATQEGGS